MTRNRFNIPVTLAGMIAAGPVLATGGHHAVDDATILQRGHCHVESWAELGQRSDYLATLSPACHMGGLEWTVGLEQERADGASTWRLAPQLKAAWPLGQNRWSTGAVLAAGSQDVNRRWEATTVLVPLSFAADHFDLHINLGYDWIRGEPDDWRYGASLYRPVAGPVAGVFAVFREANVWHGQLAFRWYLARDGLSVDLGVTGSEAGSRDGWAALGVNYEFSR